MRLRTVSTAIAALLGASALASGAHAVNLLTNGDFETGDFTGWVVTDQADGSGSWYIAGNGTGSPLNGFTTPFNPTGGTWNAQSDQFGPGSHTLSQSFLWSGVGPLFLHFDAFADDQSGAAPTGDGTDYSGPANQHFQIDITKDADPMAFYGTFDIDWGHHDLDLLPFVDGAGTYTLAFTEVDNQLFYNVGLDNLSVNDVAGTVPEPATWAMMIGGFGLAGAALRRRKAAIA